MVNVAAVQPSSYGSTCMGGLLSTQEARVALGYTSSNSTLHSCLATSHLHPLLDGCTLDVYHFLSVFCRQTENQCMEMKECSFWKGTRKFQNTYTHIRQKVHGNLYADNMERNKEFPCTFIVSVQASTDVHKYKVTWNKESIKSK